MYTSQNLKSVFAAVAFAVAAIALTPAANVANAGKPANTSPPYLLTDLDAGLALAINNVDADGVVSVVGEGYGSGQVGTHAWLWIEDATSGTVLSSMSLADASSTAYAVNDAGFVLGFASPLAVDFVDVPGIGPVVLPDAYTSYAINNSGEIVGKTWNADGEQVGALWRVDNHGTVTGPIELGGFFPQDVNDWGLMVGYQLQQVSENDWISHGAVAWFDADGLAVGVLPDLVAGGGGVAAAVNNLGEIVGSSCGRATLWTTPTSNPIDLGGFGSSIGSAASDINDVGQIVGSSEGRACLWEKGGIFDLNVLAGVSSTRKVKMSLQLAEGINNTGHIVGRLQVQSGIATSTHGVLLTPKP